MSDSPSQCREVLRLIATPTQSDWQCRLTADCVYRPAKGNEPNWFWRKMQYLAFGFKWEKVK